MSTLVSKKRLPEKVLLACIAFGAVALLKVHPSYDCYSGPDDFALPSFDNQQRKKARVLMGIFCSEKDEEYREVFRMLFSLHPLVCSLGQYELDQEKHSHCEFVYTFVTGGNKVLGAPTRIADKTFSVLLEKGDDQVALNIKENTNDGKSETWFYFATTLMNDGLDFDFVGKMHAETLIHLDKYFDFANDNLNPYPYNMRTMAGSFYDKDWWGGFESSKEEFFQKHYGGVSKQRKNEAIGLHLYPLGQFYLLSKDLVRGVVDLANTELVAFEGIEDHDIGAMAYISAAGKPMNIIMLSSSKGMKVWDNSVKRKNHEIILWEEKWRKEINRTIQVSPYNMTTPSTVDAWLRGEEAGLEKRSKSDHSLEGSRRRPNSTRLS